MLGGYPQISQTDLLGSAAFLTKLRTTPPAPASASTVQLPPPPLARVADCGAGVGRVAAGFLSKVATVVDVVEPVAKFAAAAGAAAMKGPGRVGAVFVVGLEGWVPEAGAYDLIWNQWCLGYLTDEQLVAYLRRCGAGVGEGGWVVVKENVVGKKEEDEDIFDEVDSSVTRTRQKWNACFAEAGLTVVREEVLAKFPKRLFPVKICELFPVNIWGLRVEGGASR
jgi:protein N-terminal methyltransferase